MLPVVLIKGFFKDRRWTPVTHSRDYQDLSLALACSMLAWLLSQHSAEIIEVNFLGWAVSVGIMMLPLDYFQPG